MMYHNLAVSQDIVCSVGAFIFVTISPPRRARPLRAAAWVDPDSSGIFLHSGEFAEYPRSEISAERNDPNGQAMRYMNAVLGEAEYSFSRRSAFTFSGSYGLLHFTDAGYIGSHMLNAQAGYDYLLNPKNSIAVLASYGKIDYTGASNSTVDYLANLPLEGRLLDGWRSKQRAGRKQIRVNGAGNGNFQLWTWSVNTALSMSAAARESPLRLCEASPEVQACISAREAIL